MTISVVIPCKDESETIQIIISEVKEAIKGLNADILVVDGHSQDGTYELAGAAGVTVIRDGGRGKGDGIKTAICQASGDILVFIDADGSHESADIPCLVKPILEGKADLVIASRITGGSDEFHGNVEDIFRMIGSAILTLIVRMFWKAALTDIQNGFRAIRRDLAQALNLQTDDFDIEQEMVTKALRAGLRVAEIASHEYIRKGGSSKLPTSRAWKFIYRLIKEILSGPIKIPQKGDSEKH